MQMQMSQFEVHYVSVFYLSVAFEAYLDTNVSTFPGLLAKSLSTIQIQSIVMRKFSQFFFQFFSLTDLNSVMVHVLFIVQCIKASLTVRRILNLFVIINRLYIDCIRLFSLVVVCELRFPYRTNCSHLTNNGLMAG